MDRDSWFARLLLPGFVFQSLVIAGGYGTGWEIVEFFLRLGPRHGFLAMLAAVALLVLTAGLARFGLVALIARGYGTLTWAFLAVYVVPVLTWGVWKLRAGARSGPAPAGTAFSV